MMLGLEIRLLTERFASGTVEDPRVPEWPPHPARVYSALVAALYDVPEPPQDEVDALEWLARAGPPEVLASDAWPRHLGNVFVPTNDQRVLADIDLHIRRLSAAEEELANAGGARQRAAERKVRSAEKKLLERSIASARDDGSGAPSNARELLDRRAKPQPRAFPAVIPHDPVIHLCWGVSPDPDLFEALDRVAARVARLGHSSSLVSFRFVSDAVEVGDRRRFVPSDRGDQFLRVPFPDQLERLHDEHERHRQVERRVLPAHHIRYRDATCEQQAESLPHTVFAESDQDWIVFEVVGPPHGGRRHLLDLSLAQQVARAMRGLLLSHIDLERSPPSITGHEADGSPAKVPHLAYVPLADVGYPYSSGSILGLALIPPRELETRARDLMLEAIFRAEADAGRSVAAPRWGDHGPPLLRLALGRHGVVYLQRLRGPSPTRALSPYRWTRPAQRWYTASAIALSKNPGKLYSRNAETVARATAEAERVIAADCRNLGLPEPAAVWVHKRSLLNGAPAARRFMPFPADDGGLRRVCVHAEIVFDKPVRGPLLIGAGRFFGLGLCAPAPGGKGGA
jgi:CRISPR-associated protein Csb2